MGIGDTNLEAEATKGLVEAGGAVSPAMDAMFRSGFITGWKKRAARLVNRWKQPGTNVSDLSVALDEIYALRAMLADEAGIIAVHLGYKTFPKSRRAVAERQVERMRQAARGDYEGARRPDLNTQRALASAGAPKTLSAFGWAQQRGLVPNEEEA